ncbi:MAG: class I tRNA ligase family protein, partial [Myxococcales bacterium]|nr:class I tRNA ligase family protein [Myxococcales bacterium]
ALPIFNTMPQWAGSCWYYLRFVDPRNSSLPWASEAESYWMPVDLYVGGVEHAATHLLYSRFWHKVLYDLGHVSHPEPYRRLFNQGIILGAIFVPADPARERDEDGRRRIFVQDDVDAREEDGQTHYTLKQTGEPVRIQWDKMSKSRGNVVNPDEVVEAYGADSVRMYEMFMGPLEQSAPWQTEGLAGVHRFLQRVYRLFFVEGEGEVPDPLRAMPAGEGTERQRKLLHRTIAEVTERLDRMAFNTAISSLMVFVRDVVARGPDGADDAEPLAHEAAAQFALLLAPFAPHLAEHLWQALGRTGSLAHAPWPAADEALLREDTFTLVIQVDGKRRGEIEAPKGASRDELAALARATDEVQRYLGGREPKRVIVVPGRLVNFVG